jgi:hypothetical protein
MAKEKKIDLKSLPMSEKAKIATDLGDQAGKLIETSLKKANKLLAKYGYALSVELKFHELDSDESKP